MVCEGLKEPAVSPNGRVDPSRSRACPHQQHAVTGQLPRAVDAWAANLSARSGGPVIRSALQTRRAAQFARDGVISEGTVTVEGV